MAGRNFLCPGIDRSGASSFWPDCLFVRKTFTLAISFDGNMSKRSDQSFLLVSSSRSSVKDQGHSFQKNGHCGSFGVSQTHLVLLGLLTLSQTSVRFYMSAVPQYKSFENIVENGEIAHNKQFLLFPQFFLPF